MRASVDGFILYRPLENSQEKLHSPNDLYTSIIDPRKTAHVKEKN